LPPSYELRVYSIEGDDPDVGNDSANSIRAEVLNDGSVMLTIENPTVAEEVEVRITWDAWNRLAHFISDMQQLADEHSVKS